MDRQPQKRVSLDRQSYAYAPWLADEQTTLASLSAMYGGPLAQRHFCVLKNIGCAGVQPYPASRTVIQLIEMGLLVRGPDAKVGLTSLGASALADFQRLGHGL